MHNWRRHRPSSVILAALILGAVAAIAACADDDPPAPSQPIVQQAEQETAETPQIEPAEDAEDAVEEPLEPPRDGLPFAEDSALLAQLQIADEGDHSVDYERDSYLPGGWGDADGDGCNTREEVLIAEAREITGVNQWCRPINGVWWSWYDELEFDDPGDIDIDHMVPLFEAHRSGGWQWSVSRRVAFANDLGEPAALTAVSSRSNRGKSADDPAEWRPPARSAWCQYARDWITVKLRWVLTADEAEVAALRMMLQTCEAGPESRPEERLDRPVRRVEVVEERDQSESAPSQPANPRAVYESCDQAESAGEPRVQGEQGRGRGFPAGKVPSARDGDEDGVVCER